MGDLDAEADQATPQFVARIVKHRDLPIFVRLLQKADDNFSDPSFEQALAEALRAEPGLVRLWATFSGDQRWTPSAYVEDTHTGWYDGGRQNVRVHSDQAAAVADFIRRMAAWLARREVIEPHP
jgi:hypothetical protein